MELKEATEQLLDAIREERDSEVERHEARMDVLDEVEASAKRLLDGSPPEDSPPQDPPEDEPEQEPPSPPPTKSPPRRRPGGAGQKHSRLSPEQHRERERRRGIILAFVEENPGSTGVAIRAHAKRDGISEHSARNIVRNLVKEGKLRASGERRGRKYWPMGASTAEGPAKAPAEPPVSRPAGQNGGTRRSTAGQAVTETEKAIVEELKRKNGQTAAGLGVKLKMRDKEITPALSGLVIRGVLRRKNVPTSAQPLFELV